MKLLEGSNYPNANTFYRALTLSILTTKICSRTFLDPGNESWKYKFPCSPPYMTFVGSQSLSFETQHSGTQAVPPKSGSMYPDPSSNYYPSLWQGTAVIQLFIQLVCEINISFFLKKYKLGIEFCVFWEALTILNEILPFILTSIYLDFSTKINMEIVNALNPLKLIVDLRSKFEISQNITRNSIGSLQFTCKQQLSI